MTDLLAVHNNGAQGRVLMGVTKINRVQDYGGTSAPALLLRCLAYSPYIR